MGKFICNIVFLSLMEPVFMILNAGISLTKCYLGMEVAAVLVLGMDQTVIAGTATLATTGMVVDHVVVDHVVVVTDMAVDSIWTAQIRTLALYLLYDESPFHQ
jgi:hypothetical protein